MQQMFFPTNKLLVYKVQTIYFTDLFQKLEILMIKIRLITFTYKNFNNKTATSIEFIVFLLKNYKP